MATGDIAITDRLTDHWNALKDKMLAEHTDIAEGRMMSAEALTYGGKVFVFFTTKGGMAGLGARVGRETDVGSLGLGDWQHLAPFKTKPPMKDWIVAGEGDLSRWDDLALFCLKKAGAA